MYVEKNVQDDSHLFAWVCHNHPLFAPGSMSELVSIVNQDSPLVRWVFVDAKNFEVLYGGEADSEGHIVRPWCVSQIFSRIKMLIGPMWGYVLGG